MAMIKTNNPAGRLYKLLESAKAVPASTNGYQCWAMVFKIPPYDTSAPPPQVIPESTFTLTVMEFLQVKMLVDEVEAALKSIQNINHDLYLTPFDRIKSVLKLAELHASSYPQGILGRITEGDMTVLAFCAEALDARHSEPVIEEEQIKELLYSVSELYEEVRAAEIDAKLKSLILDQLEIIRRAVHEYRIRGVARLHEALNTVVGSYVLNKDLIEDAGDSKATRDYKQVLSRFAAMVSFASNAVKLLEAAAHYIPPLLPGG